jgi:predicted lipoprotein
MMKYLLFCLALVSTPVVAGEHAKRVEDIVTAHILPRFEALSEETAALSVAAQTGCSANNPLLKEAYGTAFDAWVSASHLRMGPSEAEDRAFALAFWPDPRGKTRKALVALMTAEDAAVNSEADFVEVSIAARGFYALEYLLYDAEFVDGAPAEYHCALVQAITRDIANNAAAIFHDWQVFYADGLISPSDGGPYRNETEAVQALYKALSTGLEFTSDTRLGRPMGTLERARPKRAEAWRSGRSARHVDLAVVALADLAARLSGDREIAREFENGFARARGQIQRMDDPDFAKTATSGGRFQADILKLEFDYLRDEPLGALGSYLNVTSGFNALDGD